MWKPTTDSSTLCHSFWTPTDELYHHGILGMKWGKKNGPPYPLDAEDHSAAEKKAGWKKSIAKGTGGSSDSGERKSDEPETDADGYLTNMSDVEKKHGLKYTEYNDDEYLSAYTKDGYYVSASKGGEYSPSSRDIDKALTNFEKADKEKIFNNAKSYAYERITKYWAPEVTYGKFSKTFDRDYEVHGLHIYGSRTGPTTAEVSIDLKEGLYTSILGDHELDGEYDLNFKEHPKYWTMNG